MGAAKTTNLLAVANNYETRGRRVLVLQPGQVKDATKIKSRLGIERKVDIVIQNMDGLTPFLYPQLSQYSCVLVDDAQFLDKHCIDILRLWSLTVPVICYGLRTDYRGHLFPGSHRLFEVADSIEEIKTVCSKCSSKAVLHVRIDPQTKLKIIDGPSVPDTDKPDSIFMPVCFLHYDTWPHI